MDIFILEKVCEELKEIASDSVCRNVSALPDNTIVLELTKKKSLFYLIISSSSQFSRIHTDNKIPFEPARNGFSNTAQLHLENSKLVTISQIEGERILELVFEKLTPWQEIERRKLIVEIMGKHSNIILCKDEMIIDSIKRIDSSKSRVRQVLPGLPYQYPPKKSIMTLSEVINYLSSSHLTLEEFLIKNITGIGQLTVKEILSRAGLNKDRTAFSLNESEIESFKRALQEFQERLKDIHPIVYLDEDGNPESFYLFPVSFKPNKYEEYDLLITAATRYYDWIIPFTLLENRKKSLIKELNNQISALLKRKEELINIISNSYEYEGWKLYGDILLAYSKRIEENKDKFLVNWEGEEIEISLDPMKTPIENAQEYYRKYKKAKKERNVLPELISELEKKIESLKKEVVRIGSAKNLEGLQREKRGNEKKEISLPYLEYKFKGYEIWVGKNAKSNELITFKLSSPSDVWLHAKGYGGSHVIIRTNGRHMDYIPKEVISEAAKLAASHSKGRSGGKVLVDYALRKYVKSGGKRLGNVFYTNYKTIVV